MKNTVIEKFKSFFDRSFWIFILIGAGNTVLSVSLQYLFYNVFDMGYWPSTAIPYALCSILSFFLNKKYSFKNEGSILVTGIKFAVVIAVCYFIAYSLAQPFSVWVIGLLNLTISEDLTNNIAILLGQVVFTVLNYTGQRFFAFKNKGDKKQEKSI